MLEQIAPFGFLGLFELIGGLVAGDGLRKLVVQRVVGSIGVVVWGFGFGGIAMLVGVADALRWDRPLPLVLVGPLMFFGALMLGMLLLPRLVEELGAATLLTLTVGSVFTLLGGGIAFAIVRAGRGSTFIGLALAAVLVALGLFLCWCAVSALIRGTAIDAPNSKSA